LKNICYSEATVYKNTTLYYIPMLR